MNIVLLGYPGVGKGTQARYLEEKFNFKLLSTGDLLRQEVNKATSLGNKAKKFMDSGELVPDNIVLDIITKYINENEKKGVIFDGFPRTVPQAVMLDKIINLNAVIFLSCSCEEIIKRLAQRRVCPKCNKIYNLTTEPPKKDNRCDLCGEVLQIREDDKEEVIKNRLEVYKKETSPLLNFYRKRNILYEIDGLKPPKEVHKAIEKIILQINNEFCKISKN